MFVLTFHVEELIQNQEEKKNPCDQETLQGKQHVAHLSPTSINLMVNPHGQCLWVPSLTLQYSVKPGFPLIFLHVCLPLQQCLWPRSPSFKHSCWSHSTNKSPHQAATNNVLAHAHTLISWSLSTLLFKCIPLPPAREIKPRGHF